MSQLSIAFSFDKNYYRQVIVAVLSLLEAAKRGNKDIRYILYLLVSEDIDGIIQEEIKEILLNCYSNLSVNFIVADEKFKDSYECRGISCACYYRLLLHRFLPDLDKVIYSDVDVIFNTDLSEFCDFNIDNYYLATNKDIVYNTKRGRKRVLEKFSYWNNELKDIGLNYKNSGFMVLNLKKLRDLNPDKEIIELSKKQFNFQDQDILNILFIDKPDEIYYLSPKYAVLVGSLYNDDYVVASKENIITIDEYNDIMKSPKVFHYAGVKPWNKHFNGDKIWWNFVRKYTPYYKFFKKRFHKVSGKPDFCHRFFSFKIDEKRIIIYIFGIKLNFKRIVKNEKA